MKKLLALLLSLTMILSFTACTESGDTQTSDTNTPSTEDTTSDTATTEDETEQTETATTGELTMADLENAPVTDESMFRGRERDGEYILTGCSSEDEIIVVPETIEGYPVAIIDAAFYETTAKGIKLPDTVHTLKMGAFSMTDTLEIVSLGNGIVTVEEMALHTASTLKTLTFPEGTITLEDQSINDCEGLIEVYIPDSVTDLDQYGEPVVFCENVTIKGSANSLAKTIAETAGLPYEEITN